MRSALSLLTLHSRASGSWYASFKEHALFIAQLMFVKLLLKKYIKELHKSLVKHINLACALLPHIKISARNHNENIFIGKYGLFIDYNSGGKLGNIDSQLLK